MKKKVYISLPIAIAENTVYKRYFQSICELVLHQELKDYEIVGPVNISQFGPDGIKEPRNHKYS